MTETQYYRTGNIIRNADTGKKVYASINRAKRASHEIQMKKDGAMGRGVLRALV